MQKSTRAGGASPRHSRSPMCASKPTLTRAGRRGQPETLNLGVLAEIGAGGAALCSSLDLVPHRRLRSRGQPSEREIRGGRQVAHWPLLEPPIHHRSIALRVLPRHLAPDKPGRPNASPSYRTSKIEPIPGRIMVISLGKCLFLDIRRCRARSLARTPACCSLGNSPESPKYRCKSGLFGFRRVFAIR